MADFPSWPAWRFHESCPGGQIFETEKDVPEGWVDSPAKLKKAEEPPTEPTDSEADAPAPKAKPGKKAKAV